MGKTTVGLSKVVLNKIWGDESLSQPERFKMGQNENTISINSTDLANPVPISNGTPIDSGETTLTGSEGGDNSTDNTIHFKPGAGLTDDTAQNLNTNTSSANKTWTVAVSSVDVTKFTGLWIYIADQTTLDYLSTNALNIRYQTDTSNYYEQTKTKSQLAIGWNWIWAQMDELTEVGTVTSIASLRIQLITNNATDSWSEGDVVYDLLRQWEYSDTIKSFNAAYPIISEVDYSSTVRMEVLTTEANGFNLESLGIVNTDTNPILTEIDEFAEESKSSSDIFIFTKKTKVVAQ